MLARRLLMAIMSRASESTLWTPAEISTVLWLDASDSSTITLVNEKVSQWADKSGNSKHVTQSTLASRPAMSGVAVHGDGNDFLSGANLPMSNVDIYAVLRRTANTSAICIGQLSTNRLFFGIASATSLWFGAGGTALDDVSYTTTVGEYDIFRYRLGSAQAGLDVNGSVVRAMTSFTGTAGGSRLRLFSAGGTGPLYLTGDIAEVVIVVADTSPSEITGYLAHKWDKLLSVTTLVNALPSNHAYKTAAPTI